MIGRTAIVLVAVLAPVAATAVHAQAPRDTRAAPAGTAVLSGTVVTDDSEAKPVRRARVTCTAAEVTEPLTAITDDRGGFSCARLPAGRYTVSVTRDGWVSVAYGARRPLGSGTPIPLAAGEQARIVIRMMRGAVITGTLLDEGGRPAVNTGVVALRSTIQNGERRLVALGVPGMTDDRGAYRIYGLPPGDYFVGAAPHSGFPPPAELRATTDLDVHHARTAAPGAPAPPDRSVAFAPSYFPGTPLAAQASVLPVGPGEERSGVDFALQFVATARVEGTVSTPDGSPVPANAQITLVASGQTAFPGVAFDGLRTAHVPPDGSFSFAGIAPGVYTLLVRAMVPPPAWAEGAAADGAPQIMWAMKDISVDGDRVSGLALTLQPGLTLSGQVRFESTAHKPAASMGSVRITLQPAQPLGTATMSPGAVTPDAAGQFRVPGVTPGRYRLTAAIPLGDRPGGWIVKSALVAGQDTLDTPFVLQPNQSVADATITFTDRLAELRGSVHDAGGGDATAVTVVVFPGDPALWMPQSRRIQAVRPSPDGAYVIRNLPAGHYLVAAMDDVEPGEWFDPAFLQRLAPSAMTIAIAEGEKRVQNIRVGGG